MLNGGLDDLTRNRRNANANEMFSCFKLAKIDTTQCC